MHTHIYSMMKEEARCGTIKHQQRILQVKKKKKKKSVHIISESVNVPVNLQKLHSIKDRKSGIKNFNWGTIKYKAAKKSLIWNTDRMGCWWNSIKFSGGKELVLFNFKDLIIKSDEVMNIWFVVN